VSVLGVLLSEPSMVMMALEGLERVLQVEETRETSKKKTSQSNTPMLVSASLIEKAQDKHNSTAVKKRADRIWKQHFVSCALCHESYSKHRPGDATFCEECKCHVCSKCDCRKYHLSYQEELWAATEE
jgi:regulator of replication initiation timing